MSLLAVDIGNTTIALAAMHNGKVKTIERVDTATNPKALAAVLGGILARFHKQGYIFTMVVICSVVPKALKQVERSIIKSIGFFPKVVGREIKVPLKNCYKRPKQVGQDRLVGAYAALHLYGSPVIVIDLGTAITFDVVSAKGEYLGGAILPGLRLSAESLFLKTALLPKIDIKAPKNVIGTTTQESILSGLFYGYGSLCRGLIELISTRLKARPKVVMTGGHTRLMKKFISPKVRIIDEGLVFKGLSLLASV